MFELGPWEEAGAPGENPCRHKEERADSQRKTEVGIEPTTLSFFLFAFQEPSLRAVSYMDM